MDAVFVSFVCLESHVGFDLKYPAMHINTSIAINSVICICTLHITRCTQAITRYMSTYIYMNILTNYTYTYVLLCICTDIYTYFIGISLIRINNHIFHNYLDAFIGALPFNE